jgi:hypothetical protein
MAVMAVALVSAVASDATRRAIKDGLLTLPLFEDEKLETVVSVEFAVAMDESDFGEALSQAESPFDSLLGAQEAKAARCKGKQPCLDSR